MAAGREAAASPSCGGDEGADTDLAAERRGRKAGAVPPSYLSQETGARRGRERGGDRAEGREEEEQLSFFKSHHIWAMLGIVNAFFEALEQTVMMILLFSLALWMLEQEERRRDVERGMCQAR